MKCLIAALEARRHTLFLLTSSKYFLDEGYFLIKIHTSHNITSKRTAIGVSRHKVRGCADFKDTIQQQGPIRGGGHALRKRLKK